MFRGDRVRIWQWIALALSLAVQTAGAVIYGTDAQRDIYEVPRLITAARSVAVAVPNLFLRREKDDTYTVTDTESLEADGVCADERFAGQPSMGVCSGFLLGDRYLVTAGHCVLPNGIVDNEDHPFCQAFSWYFDYNLKRPGEFPAQAIPASRIYGCKRIIRAENLQLGPIAGNDFALIELDRAVSSDIEPLSVAPLAVRPGDLLYTLGHPLGLPAKYSGLSPVLRLDQPYYFSVNLDSLSGNSGGGVFNLNGEVVGILVSGYQFDFVDDKAAACERMNRCDNDGRNCLMETTVDQRSDYVQNIQTVLPYLPKQHLVWSGYPAYSTP